MNPETLKPVLVADQSLARRLELAEARSCAEFVETRARLFPEIGAEWIQVAGAYALFDGVASPITQTFGLGLFQTVESRDLERIEAFFSVHGAPVYHEISPLAEPALLTLLNARGYQPVEFTSVMFGPIHSDIQLEGSRNERIQVRCITPHEQDLWAQTAAAGFRGFQNVDDQILELQQLNARRPGAFSFLAELDGCAIGAGILYLCDGVALLGGASTIPEARQQGAHVALLQARMRFAAEHGCDVAMISAQPPGGGSQRNAERHGFKIAYTRIKWHLAHQQS